MSKVISFPQPAPQVQELRIELPSNTEYVGPLTSFFSTLFKNKGMEEALISNVVTAIIEAVANAMKHGNQSDIEKKTTIIVLIGEGSLHVEILDEGQGFDLATIPDPLSPENVMNLTGRGIFLIKSFMDSVDFDFSGKGTRLVMGKEFG